MAQLDYKGLVSIHGLFKLTELAVLVVTLLLARLGRQGAELVACSGDGAWLVQLTTAAWLVINPVIIIGILMDTPMSWTLDSLFSIIAAFLFTASGSVTIAYWSHGTYTAQSYSQEAGFALGAFCIITGFIMMVDAAFLIVKYGRRTK